MTRTEADKIKKLFKGEELRRIVELKGRSQGFWPKKLVRCVCVDTSFPEMKTPGGESRGRKAELEMSVRG